MTDYPNPELKKGDEVLLIKSNNSHSSREGGIYTVISKHDGGRYYCVGNNKEIKFNIYQNGPADEWVLADRKSQAEYTKTKIEQTKEAIKELEKEYERLTKFESDEEEVAFKLQKILEVKDDPKAIAEVLKELKKTDYL